SGGTPAYLLYLWLNIVCRIGHGLNRLWSSETTKSALMRHGAVELLEGSRNDRQIKIHCGVSRRVEWWSTYNTGETVPLSRGGKYL
ncbi:hypothetical protein C8R44DRAFT_778293, partial [Mycena epipterygia]